MNKEEETRLSQLWRGIGDSSGPSQVLRPSVSRPEVSQRPVQGLVGGMTGQTSSSLSTFLKDNSGKANLNMEEVLNEYKKSVNENPPPPT